MIDIPRKKRRDTGIPGSISLLLLLLIFPPLSAQSSLEGFTVARVKYRGGGDWYNDPSAIPNLARYASRETGLDIREEESRISLSDERLFSFPVLFMTGHGRITLTEAESVRLRLYLESGGFLIADDDYGMDPFFRAIMKQVFPERELVEIPFDHGIYHNHFIFENGPPKIHEHDDKAPRGFGVFNASGRLMVYYAYETNFSDGWTDPEVHGDPPEIREAALKMGTNILLWAVTH